MNVPLTILIKGIVSLNERTINHIDKGISQFNERSI
jgi:hypothetical protein